MGIARIGTLVTGRFVLSIRILLCIAAPVSYAQTLNQGLKHYNDISGLPQNSIRGITKDAAGFLWLTTEAGLVRFDGWNFKTFDRANLSTTTNRFVDFEKPFDDDHIYTLNAEQQYFKVENGQVYPVNRRREQRRQTEEARRSITWSRGEWRWSWDQYYLQLNDWHQFNVRVNKNEYYECFHDKIVYRNTNGEVKQTTFDIPDFWGLFVLGGQLYYQNAQRHFFTFIKSTPRRVELSGELSAGRKAGPADSLTVMWNGTSSDAVAIRCRDNIYIAERGEGGRIDTKLLYESFDFLENQVVTTYFDKARESLWLGTLNNGIFRLKRNAFVSVGAKKRGQTAVFYALTAINDSTVLAPGGLSVTRAGSVTKYPALTASQAQNLTMLKDDRGNFWVNSDKVVMELSGTFKEKRRWKFPSGIVVIAQGRNNEIWVAGRSPGLFRIDRDNPKQHYQTILPELAHISCINVSGEDELLIGTGNGLYIYRPRQGVLEKVKAFGNRYVRSIYAPSSEEIWITTYEEGIFLFDRKRLVHFPADKSRFLNTAHCIVEDKAGHFWVPTNRGIFKLSRKDLLVYGKAGVKTNLFYSYYDTNDGFVINEFNGGCQPCGVGLANGEIAIPSMRGIVMFDPADTQASLPSEAVFVDQVTVDEKRIPFANALKVEHDYSLITIQVTTPYFGNPANVQIAYAIRQRGDKSPLTWLPVSSERTILLSKFSSGDYKVLVRKATGFGKDNFAYKTLNLTVLPAWYENVWFALSMLALLVLLIWCLVRLRTRQLRIQNDKLAGLVEHKTSNLQATLGSLEIAQEGLMEQMRLYQRLIGAISHDIKTPLTYLTRSSRMLARQLEQHGPGMQPELVELGKDNSEYTERILVLTDNLLDFVKSKISDSKEQELEINLHTMVEEKLAIFSKVAESQKSVLLNQVEKEWELKCAPRPLSVILHNLIDNALKASRGGIVAIHARRVGEGVSVDVEDTGLGVPLPVLEWVNAFSDTRRVPGKLKSPAHSGLGLILVLELAASARLAVQMEHRQPTGTIVRVIFPDK